MKALAFNPVHCQVASGKWRPADAVLGPCNSASLSRAASETASPVDSTTKCDLGDACDGWRPRHGSERGHADEATKHGIGWGVTRSQSVVMGQGWGKNVEFAGRNPSRNLNQTPTPFELQVPYLTVRLRSCEIQNP